MTVRFAIFFSIITALVVLSHVYLYRRLVRDTVRTDRTRKVGLALTVMLASLMIGGRALDRFWPNAFTEVLGGAGFVWMGVSLFLVLTLLAMGGVRGASGLVARIRRAA